MKCEKIDTHRTYTQLQKKRTTYMYLLFSKISICDNYVILWIYCPESLYATL